MAHVPNVPKVLVSEKNGKVEHDFARIGNLKFFKKVWKVSERERQKASVGPTYTVCSTHLDTNVITVISVGIQKNTTFLVLFNRLRR